MSEYFQISKKQEKKHKELAINLEMAKVTILKLVSEIAEMCTKKMKKLI